MTICIRLLAQEPITLNQLLSSALNKNYDLEISKNEITKLDLNNNLLKYKYIPTVSISMLGAYSNEKVRMALPEYIPFPNNFPDIKLFSKPITIQANSPKIGGSLNVKWLIYSGGKIPMLKESLKHKIQVQKNMHTKIQEDIILEVTELYYKIALLNEAKKVLLKSKERLNSEQKRVKKAVEVGLAINSDLQKLKVAQIKLESKNIEYQNNKMLLFKRLEQLTHYSETELKNIETKLLPSKLPTEIEINTDIRPEIKALNEAIKAYSYYLKASETWVIPKIQLLGQINYAQSFNGKLTGLVNDISFTSKYISTGPNMLIGIGLKWDIFDGFNSRIEIQQTKADIKQAETKKEKAKELLQLNVYKTKGDYELSGSKLKLKDEELQLTKDILVIETNKYKYGLNSINDRLEAEANMQLSELEYLQAIYDQRLAAIKFFQSTNQLSIENINL
ncbi:MAG: TolC family protein [Solitalea-like symbiont of Acarus siro]